MTKTNIILLICIPLTIILGIGGGYFILNNKKQNQQSTDVSISDQKSETTTKGGLSPDTRYVDTAGFSFGYPLMGEVTDIAGTEDVYSKLSISYKDTTIELKVADTKFSDINTFITSSGLVDTNSKLVGSIKLGDLPARQYATSTKFYTIAIDKEIFYLISGDKNSEDLQNLVIGSFLFSDQKQTSTKSDNTVYESEEVVE
ncbi:hypothetical protein KW795_00925 [Candidatus Microgenomates bacterium]|nr:hypothetical protein [Candidatus Microgenomates bacterium]